MNTVMGMANLAISTHAWWQGEVFARVRDWMDGTLTTFRLRVGLTGEWLQHLLSGRLAIRAFERARSRVPAYGRFLESHGGSRISRWGDVPIMTKSGYVVPFGPPGILVDGIIPSGQVDRSSGSTGKPSVWYRGITELHRTARLMQHGAALLLGDQKASVFNTFALGPWATGMTIHTNLLNRVTMHAIGPDVDKVIEALCDDVRIAMESGEKRVQVVIGYPPFLTTLSAGLAAAAGVGKLDFSHIDIWAVGGGEAMTPARRAHLRDAGFSRVLSSYGASDLTINVAGQDDWAVALEDACAKNPGLAEELFGRPATPSIFHYDPAHYLIEEAPMTLDGRRVDRLLFTQLDDVTCPKIRYDLGDEGGVRSLAQVKGILARHGVELPDRIHPLPILFIWGRVENAVPYCGSKITPDHLLGAITDIPSLGSVVENYALNAYEDDHGTSKLRFLLELREGVNDTLDHPRILDALIDQISVQSPDFREAVRINGRAHIELAVFEKGKGPNFHPDKNTKKRYIFLGPLEG